MIREGWFRGRKTRSFTLQWHLTNACPFHCRHCYDRSDRRELDLPHALAVLDSFRAFCRRRRVRPHISLSGGDPLAYSHFWELYRAIAEAGIPVSILGNPVASPEIERLLSIHRPVCYQVSLEGLQPHNDAIRGEGHFAMAMGFLGAARQLGMSTHVMLTLTRGNLDQVLPLGEALRGLTERFTFNRLAQVGNGADLELPGKEPFVRFLREYLVAGRTNPILGMKENLLGILRRPGRRSAFGGCTGYGCGAAFNFVALLPDGEVHACRKFPSPLGNILNPAANLPSGEGPASLRASAESKPLTVGFDAIYDSPMARRYRAGPPGCRGCRLRQRCRGCLAVVFGMGLDPLTVRDPYCFAADSGVFARSDRNASGA